MTTHVVLCLPDSSSAWRCSLLDHEGTYHTPWIGQKGLDFPPNLPKILSIETEATGVAIRFQTSDVLF